MKFINLFIILLILLNFRYKIDKSVANYKT